MNPLPQPRPPTAVLGCVDGRVRRGALLRWPERRSARVGLDPVADLQELRSRVLSLLYP